MLGYGYQFAAGGVALVAIDVGVRFMVGNNAHFLGAITYAA